MTHESNLPFADQGRKNSSNNVHRLSKRCITGSL